MKLNYKRYSDQGPTVLVLHGLFGSLANFGWHCKQLADDYAVIGVDLRNHGDSPHADEMNYPVMAEDVRELMDSLGIARAVIIGHSMGGKVAMQLALSHPDYVERLLVVDIAPVTYSGKNDGHRRIMEAMQALHPETLGNRAEADSRLSEAIEDEATRKFILTNLSRSESGQYRWRLNLDAIERHYERLREQPEGEGPYEGPTLFVRGDLSHYIHKKHETEILALFPHAGVKSVMETGHWVHAEKPQVFQKIVRDFLAREDQEEQ